MVIINLHTKIDNFLKGQDSFDLAALMLKPADVLLLYPKVPMEEILAARTEMYRLLMIYLSSES